VNAIIGPEATTSYLNNRQGHLPARQSNVESAAAKAAAPALDPLPFFAVYYPGTKETHCRSGFPSLTLSLVRLESLTYFLAGVIVYNAYSG
jgi:hypothetical protein